MKKRWRFLNVRQILLVFYPRFIKIILFFVIASRNYSYADCLLGGATENNALNTDISEETKSVQSSKQKTDSSEICQKDQFWNHSCQSNPNVKNLDNFERQVILFEEMHLEIKSWANYSSIQASFENQKPNSLYDLNLGTTFKHFKECGFFSNAVSLAKFLLNKENQNVFLADYQMIFPNSVMKSHLKFSEGSEDLLRKLEMMKFDSSYHAFQSFLNFFLKSKNPGEFVRIVKELIIADYKAFFWDKNQKIFENKNFRNRVENRIFPKGKKNALVSIFNKIRANGLTFIKKLTPDKKIYELLNASKLIFGGDDLGPLSELTFGSVATESDAHYLPSKNSLIIYGGFSKSSATTITGVIAHEFGHAIYYILEQTKKLDLLNEIITCLKDEKSVQASIQQINEAFADWFATEALADLVDKATTTSQMKELQTELVFQIISCDPETTHPDHDPHPSPQKRADRILFAHPKIRAVYACTQEPTEAVHYCQTKPISK